jgi:hypothetical protein
VKAGTPLDESLTQRWTEWELTSFDYVCQLNFFSGRTFLSELPPLFPTLGSETECKPVEFYIGSPFEQIYENRKNLENFESLDVWISRTFGAGKLFQQAHQERFSRPREMSLEIHEPLSGQSIIFASLKRLHFIFVHSDHHVAFGDFVLGREERFEPQIRATNVLNISGCERFGYYDGLLISDGSSLKVVTEKGELRTQNFSVAKPKFSGGACQTSAMTLSLLSVDGRTLGIKDFVSIPSKICCFVHSRKFDITAIGCSDGSLRIRSNEDGLKVATASLDGEAPSHVLVTRRFGLVVVKTDESVFVFTSKGEKVRKVAHQKQIRLWAAFRSRSGFDYVAYHDTDGQISFFEAVEPGREETLGIGATRDVMAISFDWKCGCFVIVLKDRVLIAPMTIAP